MTIKKITISVFMLVFMLISITSVNGYRLQKPIKLTPAQIKKIKEERAEMLRKYKDTTIYWMRQIKKACGNVNYYNYYMSFDAKTGKCIEKERSYLKNDFRRNRVYATDRMSLTNIPVKVDRDVTLDVYGYRYIYTPSGAGTEETSSENLDYDDFYLYDEKDKVRHHKFFRLKKGWNILNIMVDEEDSPYGTADDPKDEEWSKRYRVVFFFKPNKNAKIDFIPMYNMNDIMIGSGKLELCLPNGQDTQSARFFRWINPDVYVERIRKECTETDQKAFYRILVGYHPLLKELLPKLKFYVINGNGDYSSKNIEDNVSAVRKISVFASGNFYEAFDNEWRYSFIGQKEYVKLKQSNTWQYVFTLQEVLKFSSIQRLLREKIQRHKEKGYSIDYTKDPFWIDVSVDLTAKEIYWDVDKYPPAIKKMKWVIDD